MRFKDLFEKVYGKQDLSFEESGEAVFAMMSGEWEPAQIASFLTALHLKGETSDEVAGFAIAMREKAIPVPVDHRETIDTCGTGGDQKSGFNISTIAAFILAGCGIAVAKHGNRAASSPCGSADLLEALGIRYRMAPEEAAMSLDRIGFAFLFAPDYHPATKNVVAVRKQLGVPTIFNLLGPLTNPARPAAQLIGVYEKRAMGLMASAIRRMDPQKRAFVLHGFDGWDEATLCGEFFVQKAGSTEVQWTPEQFGFSRCNNEALCGGAASDNAAIAIAILQGERGAKRDTALLNAALAYMVFHPESMPATAIQSVTESLDSGAARNVLKNLQQRFPA